MKDKEKIVDTIVSCAIGAVIGIMILVVYVRHSGEESKGSEEKVRVREETIEVYDLGYLVEIEYEFRGQSMIFSSGWEIGIGNSDSEGSLLPTIIGQKAEFHYSLTGDRGELHLLETGQIRIYERSGGIFRDRLIAKEAYDKEGG